jgi:cob(I)alamin adenosyltransferase
LEGNSSTPQMKIYTKTGDDGTTALFGGKRVLKSAARIEAYGTIDELNAHTGLLRDQEVNQKRDDVLVEIQDRLFTIGALLAAEPGNENVKVPPLDERDVLFLEKQIDTMDAELPPLKSFILPGGHVSVSVCHIARTVCRRAERRVNALDQAEKIDALIIKYINRLSDYFFVLGRKIALELHIEETPWKPRM